MKLSAVLLFGCVVASAAPYCDAPGAVAAELRRAAGLWDRSGPQKARIDDTRSILEALVRKYPDDIQANRRFQNDSRIPQEELIARYKERLNGEALPTYFYALTLISRDTPEAMRLFAQALAKDPDLAWAHMAMSFVYNHGRFKDKAKATEHVDAFFELCPTSYDFYSNRLLGFHGTPAVQKRVVSALRARVEAETDADLLGVYEHLWNLEFKLTSPAEHGSVRVRIISDIDRIRRMSPEPMPARVRLIRDGLWQAKDKAGATAMDDEILRRFSMTPEAEKIAVARWRKANRDERKPGYWTELYRASAEWIERWPWEPSGYGDRFAAARKLKDLPASEMKAAANGLLNFLRGNEVMYGFQPFAHQAAEEYLERGIHLAEVPRLAEEGLTLERDREVAEEKSDMDLPANPEQAGAALRAAAIGAVDLLAQSYLKLGVAEKTGELEKRLDALEAIMPFEKALKMQAASRVAELVGR